MFLRRWSARTLVVSWLVYWLALLLVMVGPTFLEWWRLQRSSEHGSVSLSFDGGLLEAALWIAGPPLLLWGLWLASRPRREPAELPGDGRPVA